MYMLLSKLYTFGDTISIYTRISNLQNGLVAKDLYSKPEVLENLKQPSNRFELSVCASHC